MKTFSTIILLLGLTFGGLVATAAPGMERLRFIIETDAGGDPDDEQSLVRFLLYADEWDIEGIIANLPYTRAGENFNSERTGLGVVRRLVEAYGVCWTNLVQHDRRFPSREALDRITVGGYDNTDGAVQLLIAAIDRPDPRPLWYSDWGTEGAATNNLKRALDRVLEQRGREKYEQFKAKLRLVSYDMFAPHTTNIAPPFKLWVNTFQPPVAGKRWYHRFSALTATAGGFDLTRDVLTGHGPLGALYPTNTTHRQKEGDTMTFLYLIPTGMNDPEQPTWGSWAGRYGPNENFPGQPYYWANLTDAWHGSTNRDNMVARWAVALQNDFRARLDWCVKPFAAANHQPVARVEGPTIRTVSPGASVTLSASGSTDPDRDALSYRWEIYPEVGTYSGALKLENAETARVSFVAPNSTQPVTIHLILSVTDSGTPPLTRYQRVIVTVR